MNENFKQTTGVTLASSFNFNDKVIINPLKVEGRVISFWLKQKDCLNIEVRYFSNNELKADYFFEEELKLVEEKVIEKEPNITVSSVKNSPVISYGRSTYGRSSLSQQIIDIFSTNKNKAHSSFDLAERLGTSAATIRSCIKQLKASNLIKIVDFKEFDDSRPLIILYQLKSSPLEELATKTKEDGYETIKSFYYDMKKEGKTIPCVSIINRLVKENNLKGQPMLYEKGLVRGYKIEELKRLCSIQEPKVEQMKFSLSQTETRKNNRKEKKVSRETRQDILNVLVKEPTKGMTALELAELLNLSKSNIQNNLKLLKEQKKIKVVDLIDTKNTSGLYSLAYQVVSSSLPTVKITKDSKRYCNLKTFYDRYKNRSIPKVQAEEILKKGNIQEIPLMYNGRVLKAYSVEDLKRVLLKNNVESSKAVITEEQQNLFSKAIKNFFKKKEKFDQEIISF